MKAYTKTGIDIVQVLGSKCRTISPKDIPSPMVTLGGNSGYSSAHAFPPKASLTMQQTTITPIVKYLRTPKNTCTTTCSLRSIMDKVTTISPKRNRPKQYEYKQLLDGRVRCRNDSPSHISMAPKLYGMFVAQAEPATAENDQQPKNPYTTTKTRQMYFNHLPTNISLSSDVSNLRFKVISKIGCCRCGFDWELSDFLSCLQCSIACSEINK